MVLEQYLEYQKVFEETASHELPPFRKWDHAIDLKPKAIPENNCKIYPLSPVEQTALNAFLNDMTAHGYIQPSISPFASHFFFVKKKDGKLRLVQDYHRLNSLTIKNQYPFPLISDVINKLKDAHTVYSPSLTFNGGITTFVFALVMSGKLPLKPTVACLNHSSCSLVLWIHPPPSKP